MADSACLIHAFSYASATPNEAKQGNPMHALGESISFGRFMSESLDWEKWSTFSHKKYVEEAERYARPGSVAQKKAFFEAHYKRIAANKAAALLQQPNDNLGPGEHISKPHETQRVGDAQETVSGSELSETPLMERPLLKNSSIKEEEDEVSSAPVKKRSALKPSKVPPSPAMPNMNMNTHLNKENIITPAMVKGYGAISLGATKPTSKSLSSLLNLNLTPAKEPDKVPPTPPPTNKEASRAAPISTKNCPTPLMTPMAKPDGLSKLCSVTPASKTPVNPPTSASKTSGPKWSLLTSVCSKSLTACRNKLQSPTLSTPFRLRTEERAARRKQNLEEKFNSKEVHKVQLQTKLKEKAGTELRKLGRSFCFKARPLPDFYNKEREAANDQGNTKKPVTHPQSLKLGKKVATSSTKKSGAPKNESKR